MPYNTSVSILKQVIHWFSLTLSACADAMANSSKSSQKKKKKAIFGFNWLLGYFHFDNIKYHHLNWLHKAILRLFHLFQIT